MELLSNIPPGEPHVIQWNFAQGPGRELTHRLGLTPGAQVRVVASHFGAVIVEVEGRRVALSQDIARDIRV